jgi:hypothetical protein
MKMVGGAYPSAMMRSCISSPDMPGIMTSEMRHDVDASWSDNRNSSADTKRRMCLPNERTRFPVASRAASSSSTIETTCKISLDLQEREPSSKTALHASVGVYNTQRNCHISGRKLYTGISAQPLNRSIQFISCLAGHRMHVH